MTPGALELEHDTDAAWVLSTPQGRRFMHRLAYDRELGMLLRSAAVTGDGDGTLRNLGRQDLARDVLALLERTSPELYDKMMVEAHGAARRARASLVPQDGDASP